MKKGYSGLTLVEVIVSVGIVLILAAITFPAVGAFLDRARAAESISNIRTLAQANLLYAADNGGRFAPAQDSRNRMRWHGARSSSAGKFDPTRGYLSPYLGNEGRVKMCPLVEHSITGSASWENGTGGYGYNAQYIGGTPARPFEGALVASVRNPSATVMFTTTAFAVGDGIQEYAYSEPFRWVDPNWNLAGKLQASVHFRAAGRAIVAWCDGSVTLEEPSQMGGPTYYGGSSEKHRIGWFGPAEGNGFWSSRR